MREERKKRIKRRVRIKNIIIISLIILFLAYLAFYFFNLRIMQIEITGTNLVSDVQVIEKAQIKDYPKIFSISSSTLKNRIKELDLVNDVKIKKNLYGKLSIIIDEAKILFYNKNNNKIILSNHKELDDSSEYLGVPTLINYVPNESYNKLVDSLALIDDDVLRMISEIEYSPSRTKDNEIIDDTRFLLRMNDSNTVYMNTVNIKKLNKYLEIISSTISTYEESSGILYLDSSIEGSSYFKSYESIRREEEEKQKEEEEKKKEEENNEEQSNTNTED